MEMELHEGIVHRITVPSGARDVLIFDTKQPGFFLRKFSTGRAMYGVKYSVAGKPRRVHLYDATIKGALAKARKEAGDVRAKARLGTDVVADREAIKEAARIAEEQAANTLGTVQEKYLTARAAGKKPMRPKTLEETRRYLENHWSPLHQKPLASITRDDAVDVLDDIEEENGPVAADRARSALSGLFTWAIDARIVGATPMLKIKDRAEGGGRERTLSLSELVEVWRGATTIGGDYARIVKLLILTGQRKAEIGSLNWDEITEDAGGARVDLPPARTKNRRPHVIMLVKQALALLPAKRNSTSMVFGQRGTGFQGWSKAKVELDDAIMKARWRVNPEAKPMQPWVVHDIRRSVVTGLGEMGIPPHVVEAIVNHISGVRAGVAGTYNRALYLDERIKALNAWATKIEKLVGRKGVKPCLPQ